MHLFFFSFRYIHVSHSEYHRLDNAMKIRSFKPRTDIHTYRSYAYLVGMLLGEKFLQVQEDFGCHEVSWVQGKILHHRSLRDEKVCLCPGKCHPPLHVEYCHGDMRCSREVVPFLPLLDCPPQTEKDALRWITASGTPHLMEGLSAEHGGCCKLSRVTNR